MPLLERVKFAAIYTSNLDEFFMIRVAGLHDQVDAGVAEPLADGASAGARRSTAIREQRPRPARSACTRCVEACLRPALAEHGIRIVVVRER